MFFERSASRLVTSTSFSASSVSVVSGTSCTWYSVERAVLERVRVVAGLLEVALGEGVAVDDQRAALRQVAQVRPQRGRVHRHEHVGRVAGREDVVVGEVELEAGDARQRAGGRADLGGEVGQRREVVAEQRRLAGEAAAGQLHAVAGVAGEADGHLLELLDLLGHHRLHRSADDRDAPRPFRRRTARPDRPRRASRGSAARARPRSSRRPPGAARARGPAAAALELLEPALGLLGRRPFGVALRHQAASLSSACRSSGALMHRDASPSRGRGHSCSGRSR